MIIVQDPMMYLPHQSWGQLNKQYSWPIHDFLWCLFHANHERSLINNTHDPFVTCYHDCVTVNHSFALVEYPTIYFESFIDYSLFHFKLIIYLLHLLNVVKTYDLVWVVTSSCFMNCFCEHKWALSTDIKMQVLQCHYFNDVAWILEGM